MCSCLDTVIDPDFHPNETTIGHFTVMNLVAKPLIWKDNEIITDQYLVSMSTK